MRQRHSTLLAVFLTLLVVPLFLQAQSYEVPINDGFVTDTAGILTAEQEEQLEERLVRYQQETSNEIAVLIIPALSGAVISDLGVDVFRDWGIGSKEHDNGVLILLAYGDREIGMTIGYGLEGSVPDLIAHGIIERDIVPEFKEGRFAEGISAGVDALQKHIGGEYTAERYATDDESGGFAPWLFFLLFIFLDYLAAIFARSKSWWLGGVFGGIFGIILTALFRWWVSIPVLVLLGLLFDYVLSSGSYKSGRGGRHGGFGGWGGGGSGGGFGGFGGGSTGGGGARGRW